MLTFEGAKQLGKAIEKVATDALQAEAQTERTEKYRPTVVSRLVPWHPKRGRCIRLRAKAVA